MSMQDPISDMLTSIRNAQAMGIQTVVTPHSKIKLNILKVLKEEGYIVEFKEVNTDNKKTISVSLKYHQGVPVIEKIKRISKPSLRVYRSYSEFPKIRDGLGIVVVSTAKGVMTDQAARALKVGGELLCTVE